MSKYFVNSKKCSSSWNSYCGTTQCGDEIIADLKNHLGPNDMYQPVVDFATHCRDGGGVSDPSSSLLCPTLPDKKSQGCSDCQNYGDSFWAVNLLNPQKGVECFMSAYLYKGFEKVGLIEQEELHLTPLEWNYFLYGFHLATKQNIIDLCGPDLYEKVWPEFYHFYNNTKGKAQVDKFLSDHPETPAACVAALKTNYTEDIQRKYGLINGWDLRNGIEMTKDKNFWSIFTGSSVLLAVPELQATLKRLTVAETDFKNSRAQYGNPFWTPSDRQHMFRLIMGDNYSADGTGEAFIDEWTKSYLEEGFITPGKSADDYFNPPEHAGMKNPYDDPDYLGQLPYLPPISTVPQLNNHRSTLDPTWSMYEDKCKTSTSVMNAILPLVAAAVAGFFGATIIPGVTSKAMAAVTLGGSAYLEAKAVFGIEALQAWDKDDDSKKMASAVVLSVGAPVTIFQAACDINLIPLNLLSPKFYYVGLGLSAGVGYFVVYPIVEPILVYGGDVLALLMAWMDVLTGLIDFFASDCPQRVSSQCYCEDANSKPGLAAAIVVDLYGTTGKQASLRRDCMLAATTSGKWGSDPFHMGTCNNGVMSTPLACIGAGEWAYGKLDSSAQPLRDEISHCLDAANPSFLPPLKEDSVCVSTYGKYARTGGLTVGNVTRSGLINTCYDFRAPLGQQRLDEKPYDWAGLQVAKPDDSCSIL